MEFAQRLISTRAGTIAVAAGAALLAGISIAVYLNRYRSSVSSAGAPVTVLVAKRAIAKGTSGSVVASQNMFTTATLRESQLREGAFSDPAAIRDRVAVRDVYKGQQLTAADFIAGAVSLPSTLTGTQRIITIPLDSAHGLIDGIEPGNRVDVYVGMNVISLGPDGQPRDGGQGKPVVRLIVADVPVLAIADKKTRGGSGSNTTNVSLRLDDLTAAKIAFASDNGKVWLALRPSAGAKRSRPDIVTVETLLLGVPPVQMYKALGGRS